MIILLIPSVLNHYKAPKEGPERAALAKAVLEGAIGREARCALITESDVLWPTRVKFQFFLPSLRPPSPAPGVEQAPGRGGNRAPFSAPKNSGGGGWGVPFSVFIFFFFYCKVRRLFSQIPPSPNPAGFLSWQRDFRVLTVDFYNRVSLKIKFMSDYAVKGIDLDSEL